MARATADFFRVPDDTEPLSFGDFVIAPHVALWQRSPKTDLVAVGEEVMAYRSQNPQKDPIREVDPATAWGLGVVLMADCALDKGRNRAMTRIEKTLRAAGLSDDDAKTYAAGDLFQRYRFGPFATCCHHHAKNAIRDQIGPGAAQAGGE